MSYQGWKNYETWCIALWLDNEQGSQEVAYSIARMPNKSDYDKAQDLKDYVEEFNPLNDTPASMFHDLLNGALSEIDWKEVLEHFQHD